MRRPTVEVKVGTVGVGGTNPIRVQSMTTSNTEDIESTVRQCVALAEVGCEIIRITAPTVPAARALREIRVRLDAAGFRSTPLVADIHFLPAAALEAAEHVEKVRINPGNYADLKKFAVREYSDADYERELQRLFDAFSPLVRRCRELGRAMRIGTNHGSLSDRILNRYGDTPLGMVESALEFVRIAESHGFYDLILSMKASNPKVMVQAYRLLVARLDQRHRPYPLHLGVTEAGDGEDGRIKSAIGIGSLLFDGIGDTIRVSLTEDSVYEIPVARALADQASSLWSTPSGLPADFTGPKPPHDPWHSGLASPALGLPPPATRVRHREAPPSPEAALVASSILQAALAAGRAGPVPGAGPEHDRLDPFHFRRRSITPLALGAVRLAPDRPPAVIIPIGAPPAQPSALAKALEGLRRKHPDAPVEGVLLSLHTAADVEALPALASACAAHMAFLVLEPAEPRLLTSIPDLPGSSVLAVRRIQPGDTEAALGFVTSCVARGWTPVLDIAPGAEGDAAALPRNTRAIVTRSTWATHEGLHPVGGWRRLIAALDAAGHTFPAWIRATTATAILPAEPFLHRIVDASTLAGGLLVDGVGDLLSVETAPDPDRSLMLAYNVLQGAGARVSKTEFVACPSCGRTLFDLQTTTQRIRARTGHLVGVKIAVMGCIVNGPGEMADADFGYVGGAPGRINLYVGRTPVKYNIPEAEAVERLVDLIREHGKWTEPHTAP